MNEHRVPRNVEADVARPSSGAHHHATASSSSESRAWIEKTFRSLYRLHSIDRYHAAEDNIPLKKSPKPKIFINVGGSETSSNNTATFPLSRPINNTPTVATNSLPAENNESSNNSLYQSDNNSTALGNEATARERSNSQLVDVDATQGSLKAQKQPDTSSSLESAEVNSKLAGIQVPPDQSELEARNAAEGLIRFRSLQTNSIQTPNERQESSVPNPNSQLNENVRPYVAPRKPPFNSSTPIHPYRQEQLEQQKQRQQHQEQNEPNGDNRPSSYNSKGHSRLLTLSKYHQRLPPSKPPQDIDHQRTQTQQDFRDQLLGIPRQQSHPDSLGENMTVPTRNSVEQSTQNIVRPTNKQGVRTSYISPQTGGYRLIPIKSSTVVRSVAKRPETSLEEPNSTKQTGNGSLRKGDQSTLQQDTATGTTPDTLRTQAAENLTAAPLKISDKSQNSFAQPKNRSSFSISLKKHTDSSPASLPSKKAQPAIATAVNSNKVLKNQRVSKETIAKPGNFESPKALHAKQLQKQLAKSRPNQLLKPRTNQASAENRWSKVDRDAEGANQEISSSINIRKSNRITELEDPKPVAERVSQAPKTVAKTNSEKISQEPENGEPKTPGTRRSDLNRLRVPSSEINKVDEEDDHEESLFMTPPPDEVSSMDSQNPINTDSPPPSLPEDANGPDDTPLNAADNTDIKSISSDDEAFEPATRNQDELHLINREIGPTLDDVDAGQADIANNLPPPSEVRNGNNSEETDPWNAENREENFYKDDEVDDWEPPDIGDNDSDEDYIMEDSDEDNRPLSQIKVPKDGQEYLQRVVHTKPLNGTAKPEKKLRESLPVSKKRKATSSQSSRENTRRKTTGSTSVPDDRKQEKTHDSADDSKVKHNREKADDDYEELNENEPDDREKRSKKRMSSEFRKLQSALAGKLFDLPEGGSRRRTRG